MIARDDALKFTLFVAPDIGHAIRRPFPLDQVGKLRRIPMKVRINHGLGVVVFGLRRYFLRAFGIRRNQRGCADGGHPGKEITSFHGHFSSEEMLSREF